VNARQIRIRPIEGPGHLVLRETGNLVEIMAGTVVLLSSAALGTELAFGRLAATLAGGAPKRIVVGGLGFGATVRGVLDVAAPDAIVTVVEKVEAVIELVRGPLAYLAELPVRELKIDKSFVMDMLQNPAHEAIVKSIIDLAHNLNLRVVAEGMDTPEIYQALSGLGCDIVQGFGVAKPMPIDMLHLWLDPMRSNNHETKGIPSLHPRSTP